MGRDNAGFGPRQSKAGAPGPGPEHNEERGTVRARVQAPRAESPVPGACPHCGVRLSALDIKMNKCFKCWAVLDEEAAVKPRPGYAGFEVHI